MTACHGVPCASAAAQAMATDRVRLDTSLRARKPRLARHDAFRGMRARQLPALERSP